MHDVFAIQEALLTFTHSDYDHISGVEAFLDLPIVVPNEFISRVPKKIKSSELKSLLSNPEIIFSETYTFGVNNPVIFTLSGGHSIDSCFGYLPKEKVLIAGDNLLSVMPQYLLQQDVDLKKIIDCLKSCCTLDVEVIIPGHGSLTDSNHMLNVLEYLVRLHDFLVRMKKENVSKKEISNQLTLPQYFEPDPNGWLERGVIQAYENLNK
jgi:glyoxylase-like metal-dependent hydrolase (beta-lactamase superfamily II)